jgi:flagellin
MEVGLTSSVRTTLSSVQRIKDLQARTQNRIATGREDQERNRNVVAAFVAKRLSNKASDLLTVKNNIGQGSSQLQVAQTGLDSINQTLNQLKVVAIQFENTSLPTLQAEL